MAAQIGDAVEHGVRRADSSGAGQHGDLVAQRDLRLERHLARIE
jgi:hypothetical protein